MRRATPWVKTECGGAPENIDLEFEKFDTNTREKVRITPKYQKYVEYVKKFFHTDNPRELVQKSWHSDILPVWCEKQQEIELVDAKTGEPLKKVANELLKIAETLLKEG